ncbi:MAG: peptidase S10 [Acidobacteria bacterium]|nr:MAG: peptidase S10 [Acidobacteriota bacterium]
MQILALLLLLSGLQAPQSQPQPTQPQVQGAESERAARPAEQARPEKEPPEEKPIETKHEIQVNGRSLKLTATTGMMPLKNEKGETEGRVFFIAYVADTNQGLGRRPLTFSFNGGPGSSSVWLHLGALGPKRVKMLDDGGMPSPPYQLVDNEHTWLEVTDLVFIDPIGTGYSRAAKPELGRKFWGLRGDIESVGEFIRLYLTRYERWSSPLFLVGESYGTTRAAGLAGYLVERSGIAFNGIMLVSSILNFQTAEFDKGNDLPYVLFLPTYTATAWFHKRLPADLQADLKKTLAEVERFAGSEYTLALAKGDALSASERTAVVRQLARFTGLSESYIAATNLRITQPGFCKELLRDQRRTVGRLDSRFKGIDEKATGERPEFDPSMAAIRPPYTAMFNDYVRRTLGYKTDLNYYILGGGITGPWEFPQGQFADTSESLRSAFSKNPSMKLFVASGYYDLATPYFATRYTLAHMGLDRSQLSHVSTSDYQAGHMMYIDIGELARLKKDVAAFITSSLQ